MSEELTSVPIPQRAFPVTAPGYDQGMTLRDYFAAKAMQSFLIGASAPDIAANWQDYDHFAKAAYMLADAMLKGRGQ